MNSPVDGVNEDLVEYMKKWESLNSEIMKHEETIEKQRRQLSTLNISLNDRELGADTTQQGAKPKKTRSAAEIIAQEEEEIRRLEADLAQRTRGQI